MSERLAFVKRWLDGERVADLCREYGINRKTAYKMRARYETGHVLGSRRAP